MRCLAPAGASGAAQCDSSARRVARAHFGYGRGVRRGGRRAARDAACSLWAWLAGAQCTSALQLLSESSHGFFALRAGLLLFGSNARGAGEFLEAVRYRLIVGGSDRQLFVVPDRHSNHTYEQQQHGLSLASWCAASLFADYHSTNNS